MVDYDPLPVVVDPNEALKDEMLLFPDVGTNVAGRAGRRPRTPTTSSTAATSSSRTRSSASGWPPCPLEPRSAAADGRRTAADRLALHAGAAPRPRRRSRACSGSSRPRCASSPRTSAAASARRSSSAAEEAILVAWLARKLGGPVRWTETRSENMLALPHGRAQRLELHDRRHAGRQGARLPARHPRGLRRLPGARRLPAEPDRADGERRVRTSRGSRSRGRSVVTNTTPIDDVPRRRPAGGDAGDRAHDRPLRRRDRHGSGRGAAQELHPKDAFPHTTPPARRTTRATTRARSTLRCAPPATTSCAPSRSGAATRAATKQLGIGLSSYVEITNPLGEAEFGEVEITADGGAIVRTGSFSHGQGHETSLRDDRGRAARAAAREGHRRTRATPTRSPTGTGTFGSKSMQIGGTAARGARTTRRRAGEAARRRLPRGERRRHRARHGARPLPRRRDARPVALVGGARDARRRRRPARRAEGRARVPGRRRRSRSARTSPSSRSTSRPAKVELAADRRRRRRRHARSTRCSPRARCTAASRSASRRRSTRTSPTTRTARR